MAYFWECFWNVMIIVNSPNHFLKNISRYFFHFSWYFWITSEQVHDSYIICNYIHIPRYIDFSAYKMNEYSLAYPRQHATCSTFCFPVMGAKQRAVVLVLIKKMLLLKEHCHLHTLLQNLPKWNWLTLLTRLKGIKLWRKHN